jgi:nitroreductase
MDAIDAIKTRRTVRLFKRDVIKSDVLLELVECGRCAPAAANRQPLQYIIVNEAETNAKVFECLAWAGYVKPKRTPPADKRPVAYIIVLMDKSIGNDKSNRVDAAAGIENMLIAAQSMGIGSCWLGAIDKDKLREICKVPEGFDIDSVVALGYPGERPVMEDCKDESIKYYLDEADVLHVPKRTIKSIVHYNRF